MKYMNPYSKLNFCQKKAIRKDSNEMVYNTCYNKEQFENNLVTFDESTNG